MHLSTVHRNLGVMEYRREVASPEEHLPMLSEIPGIDLDPHRELKKRAFQREHAY